MTIDRVRALALLLLLAGCGAPSGGLLGARAASAPPEVRAACDLTAQRCSRCHPIERLMLARVSSPVHWERYVERMRHQPESGITEDEGRIIVRCLVFRSFGSEGHVSVEGRTP
jgi:hypothetical protein